ncbi:MAG: DDE endonuclease [Gammaproteobacteria bacterium RIFCSPHIGHO2_12_FULL_41_20]|nr:MAG: DDE endonuclease [Gammaproteobacteria bacterium RIFCSPHIGHO2_12_FULL_41_20]
MPKKAAQLVCSKKELDTLTMLANGRKVEKRLAERAKIVLLCHEGLRNDTISKKLQTTVMTVAKWRNRFNKDRIEGLNDKTRSGKPKKYDESIRNNILKLIEQPVPRGQSNWDGESIAKRLGISHDIVWRILRKEGIQLQRMRSWCVSTDKEFTAKAADIIGLYLNPPEKALVLSVDEKPSIQALERKIGFVETSSGKIVKGLQSTYKRNGTLNLFAALNVATGQIKAKTTKRPDFQQFLDDILQGISSGQEVHVILDNYCTHKKNEDWLQKHPNVYFHYTPTSASWLNQVEIWFGILTRKALRSASFSNTDELKKAIEDFINGYSENSKPFAWKKREVRGSQLRNTITNLCN